MRRFGRRSCAAVRGILDGILRRILCSTCFSGLGRDGGREGGGQQTVYWIFMVFSEGNCNCSKVA